MFHVRHGDVLLTRVDALPEGEEVKHSGSHVLAYGEVTGHKHLLTAGKSEDLKVIRSDGVTFLSLAVPMPLSHEEHATVEVPSGIWKMTFEREYDPYLSNIRQVID